MKAVAVRLLAVTAGLALMAACQPVEPDDTAGPVSTATAVPSTSAAPVSSPAATSPAPKPDPKPAPATGRAKRSGLPWPSGVNGYPVHRAAEIDDFGEWRGVAGKPIRPDVAVVTVDMTRGWSGLENPDWLYDYFAGWDGTLVIGQPMWPSGNGNMAECASGAYAGHFATFGKTLVQAGRGASIIRIGWEFNGDWWFYSAHNSADYVKCFRSVAQAINSTAPDALIDWTVNAHGSWTCGGDTLRNCYPGDDVVDIVGIDSYDDGPASPTAAAFNAQATGTMGITSVYNFAVGHKKKFGVGEWGVAPGKGGTSGGDNPVYIEQMVKWFADHAANLAYEAYFNICDAEVDSALFKCHDQNPKAAGRYQELYRAQVR